VSPQVKTPPPPEPQTHGGPHLPSIREHLGWLGFPATDKVTGFAGVVSSICFDLYGCVQVALSPKVREGKMEDGRWFDVSRLHRLGNGSRIMPVPTFALQPQGGEAAQYPGGPQPYTHGPADKPGVPR